MQDTQKKQESDVVEMALCETQHLFLRPDQLYVFRVVAGCKECELLAKIYQDEKF